MKKLVQPMKGFTLIELLIVLAIIGVLIALAIIGLQAAQGAQRDTARKDIGGEINSQLQIYQSTNGNYPSPAQFLCYTGGTNTAPCFIDETASGVCTYGGSSTGGVTINGKCFGLNGLTDISHTVDQSCTTAGEARNSGVTNQEIELCYQNSGSTGYTFGYFLESQKTPPILLAQ